MHPLNHRENVRNVRNVLYAIRRGSGCSGDFQLNTGSAHLKYDSISNVCRICFAIGLIFPE